MTMASRQRAARKEILRGWRRTVAIAAVIVVVIAIFCFVGWASLQG